MRDGSAVRWEAQSPLLQEEGWLGGVAKGAMPKVGQGIPCCELMPMYVCGRK